MRTHQRFWLLLCVAILTASCGGRTPTESERAASIEKALGFSSRSDAEEARDAGRKPAAVLGFLGIRPGMTVLDLVAAGGYYTEVLSIAVGPEGKVYAQNPAIMLTFRDGAIGRELSRRLEGGRLPNVVRLDQEVGELEVEPGSVDAALTALNFHDIYNRGGNEAAQGFLLSVEKLLKPGGTLGIVDHSGGVGDDAALHRIDESLVKAAALQAGFELVAESNLLRNPADDRTQGVFTKGLRGHTDRFVLRLRKPR
jgi:predicted methyltransferase